MWLKAGDRSTRGAERTAAPTPEDARRPFGESVYPPLPHAWYVVSVLTLAYVFSFIDRRSSGGRAVARFDLIAVSGRLTDRQTT